MKYIDSITLTEAMLTSSSVTEDDHPEWSAAVDYAIGDRVISTTTHSIYQCLIAHGVSDTPVDPDAERADLLNPATADPDPQYWGYVGFTNRYRMFDRGFTTATTDASPVTVRITPGQSVAAIAFFGMSCDTIQIVVTDPTDGELYNETIDMTFSDAIVNIWDYFNASFDTVGAVVRDDLPGLYPNAYIDLTFTGSTVVIGEVDFGPTVDLGETHEDDTYFERFDPSTVTTDAFGEVTDTKRPVLKISYFSSEIDRDRTQTVRRRLDKIQGADKRTWIGSGIESYDAIAYGYLDSSKITYEDAYMSIIKLRVIGVL